MCLCSWMVLFTSLLEGSMHCYTTPEGEDDHLLDFHLCKLAAQAIDEVFICISQSLWFFLQYPKDACKPALYIYIDELQRQQVPRQSNGSCYHTCSSNVDVPGSPGPSCMELLTDRLRIWPPASIAICCV